MCMLGMYYVVGNMESTTHIGLCFYRIEYISDLKWTSEMEVAVGTGMELVIKSYGLLLFTRNEI